MGANPYEYYKRQQVETSSPGRLLLMLYEAALKNLRMAQKNIEDKKIVQAHNCLMKSQAIVQQLNSDLNMEAGGEIAQNLRSLYVYINKRLVEANVNKDIVIVQEVIELLSELKEAWDVIILKKTAAADTL